MTFLLYKGFQRGKSVYGKAFNEKMAKTKDEVKIDWLCESNGFKPKKVYNLSKFLLEGARIGYSALTQPIKIMTPEEVVLDKQASRRVFLELMVQDEKESEKDQRIFIYKCLQAPWLWSKIEILLKQVEFFGGPELGVLYRVILTKLYFSNMPETNGKLADSENVTEGVIEYRKREAIKLFGIMIWIYCEKREAEDIAKGIVSI